MRELLTLRFPDNEAGQRKKVLALEEKLSEGWHVISETIIRGRFSIWKGFLLGLLFFPCGFFAGTTDGEIVVKLAPNKTEEDSNAEGTGEGADGEEAEIAIAADRADRSNIGIFLGFAALIGGLVLGAAGAYIGWRYLSRPEGLPPAPNVGTLPPSVTLPQREKTQPGVSGKGVPVASGVVQPVTASSQEHTVTAPSKPQPAPSIPQPANPLPGMPRAGDIGSGQTPLPQPPKNSPQTVFRSDELPAQAFVRGIHVNVRNQPQKKARVVSQLSNAVVTITETQPGGAYPWYKITGDFGEGWVYGQFIEKR